MRPGRPVDYRGATTLITGASSGLGAEFASQLAGRGADLVLVARRKDRLDDLGARLAVEHGITATSISLDLSAPSAPSELLAELASAGIGVASLVNCAGFGMVGDFASSDPERLANLVAVNVATLTGVTRALLPQLLSADRGVLINIASTAAYQPVPAMAAYGASKAYVLSLTEAIAFETRKSHLKTLALSPGPTRTEFFDVVGTEDAAVGNFQTPREVVELALHELDKRFPRASIVSGRRNGATAWLASVLPRPVALAGAGRAIH